MRRKKWCCMISINAGNLKVTFFYKYLLLSFFPPGALTNIPQFFEHLKENIEALKLSPRFSDSEENDEDSSDENDENDHESEMADGYYNQKDNSKLAARRLKAELLVDENLGRTSGNSNHQTSGNKNAFLNFFAILDYYTNM